MSGHIFGVSQGDGEIVTFERAEDAEAVVRLLGDKDPRRWVRLSGPEFRKDPEHSGWREVTYYGSIGPAPKRNKH